MHFKPALYDGSDPLYRPLTYWVKGKYLYWKASAQYTRQGASSKPIRVHPGVKGDGQELERAKEARRLTQELVEAFGDAPNQRYGTWASLIHRYRTDSISPFHDIKFNTAASYNRLLDKWNAAIGAIEIADTSYETIVSIKKAMQDKGRSVDHIHRMFTMLRTVCRYGLLIEAPGAARVSVILSNMKFETPVARQVAPTEDQIMKIIAEADERGLADLSLGLLVQWWFSLRAVDVRGQWQDITAEEAQAGGVIRHSFIKRRTGVTEKWNRWQDGLTWDMVSDDCTSFTKVPSKTAKSNPTAQVFPISAVPGLQERFLEHAKRGRIGPVILSADGKPYSVYGWGTAFRRLRDHLGLPSEIQMMDTRAGSITDASIKGVTTDDLRSSAVHADAKTTQRYIRAGEETRAKVVQMRLGQGK